ncbi:unnamed protein product, partial [marine sediment metagenome]
QRRVIEARKKMLGQPSIEIPDEIVELDEQIKKLKGELAALTARETVEPELELRASELAPLEYRYRQLLISFKLEK